MNKTSISFGTFGGFFSFNFSNMEPLIIFAFEETKSVWSLSVNRRYASNWFQTIVSVKSSYFWPTLLLCILPLRPELHELSNTYYRMAEYTLILYYAHEHNATRSTAKTLISCHVTNWKTKPWFQYSLNIAFFLETQVLFHSGDRVFKLMKQKQRKWFNDTIKTPSWGKSVQKGTRRWKIRAVQIRSALCFTDWKNASFTNLW